MCKRSEEARKFSLGVRFWGLLTAMFFTFGLLSFILLSQASKITDEKDFYIGQLEQQVLNSNEKYARTMADISNELYGVGKSDAAVYVLKDVMNADGQDKLMPYSASVRYALTQAMGVYASNMSYVPLDVVKAEDGVEELSLSEERTRLYVCDEEGNYRIYDTATLEELAVLEDVSEVQKPFWVGENLFYLDLDRDIAMCSADGSKLLVEEGNYAYFSYLADRNLYAYSHREVIVISPENGKVLKRFVTPELTNLMEVDEIYLTTESIYIAVHSAADSHLVEYTPEGTFVGRYLLSDIEPGCHVSEGNCFYYLTSYKKASRQLVCFDTWDKKEKWSASLSLPESRKMMLYEQEEQTYIILYNDSSLLVYDANGNCVCEQNYTQKILAVEAKKGSGYIRVILSDNTYQLIETTDWASVIHSFYDKQPLKTADATVISSTYLFVHFEGREEWCRYGVSEIVSEEYKEDARKGIVNKCGTLQLVCEDSEKKREYILYDFRTGEEKVRLRDEYRSFAFIGDGSEYFVLYGSTLDVCSVEDAHVIYSFENATLPLFSTDYDAVYLPNHENGVYNLLTGKKVGTMMNKADAKELNLVLGNKGETYALLSENLDNIFLYETSTGNLIAQESLSLLHAKDVSFSTDGKLLAILTDKGNVELYDGTTLKEISVLYDLDTPGNKVDVWYETNLHSYIVDTQGRDYVLDAELHPIADMMGITAFCKEGMRFLREEEMGYWYVDYIPYEKLVEMAQKILEFYAPEEDILNQY